MNYLQITNLQLVNTILLTKYTYSVHQLPLASIQKGAAHFPFNHNINEEDWQGHILSSFNYKS